MTIIGPYVTSVGATKFIQDAIGPEQSTSWSGGGFSWHFDAPDYQVHDSY